MLSCNHIPVLRDTCNVEFTDTICRTVQLVATAVLSSISFYSTSYKGWIQNNQWMMWISVYSI